MYGYALAALAYGARPWVIGRQTLAFGAAVLPFGTLPPAHVPPGARTSCSGPRDRWRSTCCSRSGSTSWSDSPDCSTSATQRSSPSERTRARRSRSPHAQHPPARCGCSSSSARRSHRMFGAVLGAPTLRLRGDYLAIVTLGFGEIIPRPRHQQRLQPDGRTERDLRDRLDPTSGSSTSAPARAGSTGPCCSWSSLSSSCCATSSVQRLGRAWVAMREDEVAAACHRHQHDDDKAARLRDRRFGEWPCRRRSTARS